MSKKQLERQLNSPKMYNRIGKKSQKLLEGYLEISQWDLKMETEKVMNYKSTALVLVGIVIGATVASALYFVDISIQPTIYDKLTEAGITYFLSHWEPNLLENRTYVHQFRDFNEIVQLVELLKIIDDNLVVNLDNVYNIIWRIDPTNEGWISIYFYLDPD